MSEYLHIIEDTDEAKRKFHSCYWGASEEELTMEHINALLNGKALAYTDGEYSHVFTLKKEDK